MVFWGLSWLASCGGGGNGCQLSTFAFGSVAQRLCNAQESTMPQLISGVAAGSGPILGHVEITDPLGSVNRALIQSDGTYQVDVSGMTGPFILKATGSIGNEFVTYYSAATEADIRGVVNITPFTDLILSTIAGDLVSVYLSDAANIPKLAATITDTQLRSIQSLLVQKIKPLLVNLGVSDNIDLIQTFFKLDRSGLDALLNLVKFEYNTNALVVTWVNVINQGVIDSIDVTQPLSSMPVLASTIQGIDISAVSEVEAMGQVLSSLENLFSRGLPTLESLTNSGLFDTSDGFVDDGQSFQEFANELITESQLVGASFKSWSLVDYQPGTQATIDFTIALPSRTRFLNESITVVLKKITGRWRISGNQQIANINFKNEQLLTLKTNNRLQFLAEPIIRNGIGFYVDPFEYNAARESPSQIASAEISGRGLPSVIRLTTNASSLAQMSMDSPRLANGAVLWDCASALPLEENLPCLNVHALRQSSPYKVVLKDLAGLSLNGTGDQTRINQTPLSFDKISQNNFVKIMAVQMSGLPLTASGFLSHKTMRVDFKVPADLQIDKVNMTVVGNDVVYLRKDYEWPVGQTFGVLDWHEELGSTRVTGVQFRIVAYAQSGRKFVTFIDIGVPLD